MADLILQNPVVLLLWPLLWLLMGGAGWRRRFTPFGPFALRLLIMLLVVFALARPAVPAAEATETGPPQRTVLLVDQSLSLSEAERHLFRSEAARLAAHNPAARVLYFADQPVLVPFPAQTANEDGAAGLPLNPELTNLGQALTFGAAMLGGQPGRLALLSDGLVTEPAQLEAAMAELSAASIPVDVLVDSPKLAAGNEIRLVDLTVPPILREGEPFQVEATLHSSGPAEATLELIQDATILADGEIFLEAGLNRFSFEVTAQSVGPHTFRATVTAAEAADSQPGNNSFSAFSQVFPPPQILVVGDEPVPASRFGLTLEEAGFVVRRIRSTEIPNRLSELEPYAGMVLLNVSARSLELEQMIAVQEFVRSLGRGLLVTGGRNSFSLGQYEETPLADLLPFSLEPPPREERPPVAMLLIIDHSGSMIEQGFSVTKLAMAKEAAIRATDILGPDDLIGVLIFDNRFDWVVPFQAASDGADLLQIQSQIATIAGGGGTRILQALEIGLPELAALQNFTGPRHAILFSDGKSFDGIQGAEDYDRLVEAAVEAGITLSTIAVGEGADVELLSRLAEQGLGRYHFAAAPEELPELTIAESDILRSDSVEEGEEYLPSVFAPHPMLRGLLTGQAGAADIPNLQGYIGLTPKPQAEIALQVGPGDPLLGVWGYGLGRVAAWSSDVGDEWAGDFYTWPESARFWGQVLGYTLPAPNLGLLQLGVTIEPDRVVTLIADGLTATGQPVDLARTQANLTTPGGREVTLDLRQVSPGRYQQRLRLTDPGAYQLTVSQARGPEPDETATLGFVLPYSGEYALLDQDRGEAQLRQLAAATEGVVFLSGETPQPPSCDPQQNDCPATSAQLTEPTFQDLWPWPLLAALILWPVEIAWRRWRRLRIQ